MTVPMTAACSGPLFSRTCSPEGASLAHLLQLLVAVVPVPTAAMSEWDLTQHECGNILTSGNLTLLFIFYLCLNPQLTASSQSRMGQASFWGAMGYRDGKGRSSRGRKEPGRDGTGDLKLSPSSLVSSSVSLNKLPNLSEPHNPHLTHEANTYLTGLV